MCHKGYLQIAGFECRYTPIKNSSLGATHNTRSEIDKINAIANHDRCRRTGMLRIGYRGACSEEHDPGPGRAFASYLASQLLRRGRKQRQQHSRMENETKDFHTILW